MSLINEMLHDLDSGRGKPEKAAATDPLLSDSGLLNSNSNSTWIPGVIAFLVVASLLLLQQLGDTEEASSKDTAIARVSSEAGVETGIETDIERASQKTLLAPNYYPKLIKAMTPQQPLSPSVVTVPERGVLEPQWRDEDTVRAEKISELLAAASKAFALDRLLSPADDNACDRYREILLLQPNHPQAIAGLESAAARYINLALDYAEQGNLLRAKVLLRRAESVMPESALVRDNIEQARLRVQAVNTQNKVLARPVSTEQNTAQERLKVNSAADAIVQSEPIGQSFVRSSSVEWQDLNTARSAKKLLSKGRSNDAVQVLEHFVETSPNAVHSLDLLLHTLIEQGRTVDAQRYLLAATHLSSSDIVEYNAHILVAADSVPEAIALLETQLPSASEDYSYQVLLAGLYHRDGNYTSSVAAYSRLLREHEKKSEYWLGLAVSLDSLNRDEDALQAFISAKDATQNKQVQRYIAARIQALSNKVNANDKLPSQAPS